MIKTILVIEDYIPLREATSRLLRCHGYETLEAGTGEGGIAMASSLQPDIILLDLGLPGIDGWEVLSRLKGMKATENIAVVIATAEGTSEIDVAHGYDMGVADYILKPYFIEELIAAFEAVGWWQNITPLGEVPPPKRRPRFPAAA